jgi:hypothetical protein
VHAGRPAPSSNRWLRSSLDVAGELPAGTGRAARSPTHSRIGLRDTCIRDRTGILELPRVVSQCAASRRGQKPRQGQSRFHEGRRAPALRERSQSTALAAARCSYLGGLRGSTAARGSGSRQAALRDASAPREGRQARPLVVVRRGGRGFRIQLAPAPASAGRQGPGADPHGAWRPATRPVAQVATNRILGAAGLCLRCSWCGVPVEKTLRL